MITADVIKFSVAGLVTFVAGYIWRGFTTSKPSAFGTDLTRKRSDAYAENTMQRLKDKNSLSDSLASPPAIPNDLRRLLNKKDSELTAAEYYRVAAFTCEVGETLIETKLPAWIEVAQSGLGHTDRCIAVDILSHDYVFGETCSEAAAALKTRRDKARIYVANIENQLLSTIENEMLFAGRQ